MFELPALKDSRLLQFLYFVLCCFFPIAPCFVASLTQEDEPSKDVIYLQRRHSNSSTPDFDFDATVSDSTPSSDDKKST
uniref:Secreted protein n=1 Tax=Panagrellus redivivus TaxID=6233 RepID=A0A7E4V9M7_PANRE